MWRISRALDIPLNCCFMKVTRHRHGGQSEILFTSEFDPRGRDILLVGAVAATGVGTTSGAVPAIPPATTLKEFKDVSERLFLVQKLRENDWNISRTADVIDTPRSNLYKKLEQYTISQDTDG